MPALGENLKIQTILPLAIGIAWFPDAEAK